MGRMNQLIVEHCRPNLSTLLLTVLALGGCNSNQLPAPGPIPPVEDRSDGPGAEGLPDATVGPTEPATPRSDASQATLALLRESESAQARGEQSTAITYVERAIRLEPRRSDLWLQLARLQLPDQPVAAERYARKALSLAAGNEASSRAAWLVIADAKQAAGDAAAAEAIRDRYRILRG